jgi:hypothetical protein
LSTPLAAPPLAGFALLVDLLTRTAIITLPVGNENASRSPL